MKIQCSCGAKYAFDLTPDMAVRPIRFICQNCGLDSSDAVNELIRQEFAKQAQAGAPAAAPVATAVATPVAAPVAVRVAVPRPVATITSAAAPTAASSAPGPVRIAVPVATARPAPAPSAPVPPPPPTASAGESPRLRIARAQSAAADANEAAAGGETTQYCLKHNNQPCVDHCRVCKKPICPKCMELFGYFCSPFCKGKAEASSRNVPVFAGQKAVVEQQFWRKVGRITAVVGSVVALLLGFWFWYAWFGSVPHSVFSVRFTDKAYSGGVSLCGKNQIVFIHGLTLARYDLKSKKEIWSHQLVEQKQIDDAVAEQIKSIQEEIDRAKREVWEIVPKMPDREELVQETERGLASEMGLHIAGQNVWVSSPGKLIRFDWDTGKEAQTIPVEFGFGGLIPQGDELLVMQQSQAGQAVINHINLADGQSHTEAIGLPVKAAVVVAQNSPVPGGAGSGKGARGQTGIGLPTVPGANMNTPLDPAKVAQQAQNLSLAGRIALPATLANARHQEQILREANADDTDPTPRHRPSSGLGRSGIPGLGDDEDEGGNFMLIPSKYGYVQFSARLLEKKIVSREAMKAPPKRSALNDANLNVTKTADVANEILNEMQREHGGSTVEEDVSRYQVTIHRPDGAAPDWTGDVVGPPAVHPLKTVNVLTAGKTVTVFDKNNKKLWQASLTYNVLRGGSEDEDHAPYGQGPCVERGDALYLFDQAVLTAFDLATGNVRWRVPSVGIVGMFFDDKGMLYVNTTSASPDSIKYAKQIDINASTDALFVKVDPKKGKILWTTKPGTFVSYLSGQYIYTVMMNDSGDEPVLSDAGAGLAPESFLRIKRISPRDGRILWEHDQGRAPIDIKFDKNSIQLVFKKEVQVLKFMSF